MNKKIVIFGYGVVGHNMQKLFPCADIVDPAQSKYISENVIYDFGFICVPTEMLEDGSCDISIVKDIIKKYSDMVNVFCIRSTVPPGFTQQYSDKCVFQPEYYGATQHANDNNYDFIILGGTPDLTNAVADLYKTIYTGELHIFKTDSTSAELVKYMENSWLATKVTFCNEWFRVCNKYGVDYDSVREMWLADPRVNRSHSFVYRDKPFYDSHCLNKDIPAIISAAEKTGYTMNFMKAVKEVNDKHRVS